MKYIYLSAFSWDGFRHSLIEALEKSFDIELAEIYPRGGDSEPDVYNDHTKYFGSDILFSIEHLEFESMKALPRDILDGMLADKCMIMSLMMRTIEYDVYDFQYLETCYYRILSYCYRKLKENDWNLLIHGIVPHHAVNYTFYCLAKLLGIKQIIFMPTMFPGRFFLCENMEFAGREIANEYCRLCDLDQPIYLGREMQQIYEQILSKKGGSIPPSAKKWFMRQVKPVMVVGGMGKWLLSLFIRNREEREFYKNYYKRRTGYRLKALRHISRMKGRHYYEHLAENVDMKEKFIYFGLQMTPECTTAPMAGEFKNQLLSIRLLAEAAQINNVQVYVKEHWVQYCREKWFYEELTKIPNVTLVSLSVPARDLIANSIAVSTQTGSCVVEGIAYQKNSLVFGSSCPYIGGCGVHLINSVEQCAHLIKNILEGKSVITQRQSIAYYKAIENKAYKYHLIDDTGENVCDSYSVKESVQQLVNRISTILN